VPLDFQFPVFKFQFQMSIEDRQLAIVAVTHFGVAVCCTEIDTKGVAARWNIGQDERVGLCVLY
jgi:hypothetical protein